MQVSYSRIGTFLNCPYKWKLSYIDELTTLPSDDPQNALILGHALHTGIEKDVDAAVNEYFNAYPVIDDKHINESIKLKNLIPKVKAILPEGQHEVELQNEDFIAYIDLLVPINEDTFDIYDFKYSNNINNYMESAQLHVYKWLFEKLNPTKHIRKLYFVFIPKTMIRQKKTEDLIQFRKRLNATLNEMIPTVKEVTFDSNKVVDFLLNTKHCVECKEFDKNESRLCDWCDFQKYCQEGEDYMILPKNERVEIGENSYMKGWIYGPPFSGKTTFLDQAPDPLNLNTDGNTKYVSMQRLRIRDEVTVEGRQTKTKFAWETFKEAVDELATYQNDFKTIIVDLVEDTREMCRVYMYDKEGWEHESDGGYGKGWDMIKTEYLSTMKRLLGLDYNIFLVSHEDTSKEITKAGGEKITKIAPNIQEALANKLAGMVDFVARVVINKDDTRSLSFKTDNVIFGGGRLHIEKETIPLDWNELVRVYEEANTKANQSVRRTSEVVKDEPKNEQDSNTLKEETTEPEVAPVVEEVKVEPNEEVKVEPAKRTRKRRV